MKKGLGKGLDALLFDNSTNPAAVEEGPVKTVSLQLVEPNKKQPRKYFDKEALEVLAQSIAENGLLQPLVVRACEGGRYQIISGERRWRACRLAGLREIPVVVREEDDRGALELGLIENLQREDLNVVEEAEGYRVLMEEYSMTQEQVASKVGKSRPAVANALRILSLPEDVLALTLNGGLTSGHARALLPLCDKWSEEEVCKFARSVSEKALSVRDTENLVRLQLGKKSARQPRKKDIYLAELEHSMTRAFGRKVRISAPKGKAKGKIELEYYNTEDLNDLLARFGLEEGE
ncbi:MAG: ParB/RepB/Spo0J family partition protein [Clostridia bacterium]|nr:ParB/RepB/Spo0J family partition protein [Clostridia bacterium]MBQ5820559.1 ParB/RepB/Spo0J family partition protein [Clostridia bacterium]